MGGYRFNLGLDDMAKRVLKDLQPVEGGQFFGFWYSNSG